MLTPQELARHALELYRKGQPQAAALYWNAAKNLLTNR